MYCSGLVMWLPMIRLTTPKSTLSNTRRTSMILWKKTWAIGGLSLSKATTILAKLSTRKTSARQTQSSLTLLSSGANGFLNQHWKNSKSMVSTLRNSPQMTKFTIRSMWLPSTRKRPTLQTIIWLVRGKTQVISSPGLKTSLPWWSRMVKSLFLLDIIHRRAQVSWLSGLWDSESWWIDSNTLLDLDSSVMFTLRNIMSSRAGKVTNLSA